MVREAEVLRLSHRAERDYRVTTHCCLVARAFGAKKITIIGQEDPGIRERVSRVTEKWGGKFRVEFNERPLEKIKGWKRGGNKVVHLTMYGLPLEKVKAELKRAGRILVIVGSEKVPREVYKLSDFNVSITNQPHSEIAALAVFLYCVVPAKDREKHPGKAKLRITPAAHGKKFG